MLYWKDYKGHEPKIYGKKIKYDNNIYSFDIETSSFIISNGTLSKAEKYQELSKKEQELSIYGSNMYIWMFSINTDVYYGRTWEEFKLFLDKLEECVPVKKIIFIHNLAFEFQYLKSYFDFKDVMARKSHKVMKSSMCDYNIELRCSYMMSNCSLAYLPKLYNLPVDKKVGDLDYSLLRHSKTSLSDKELGYCEYDCLVIYYYIKYELDTYQNVNKIPLTSTGHVRRELKELIRKDYKYKRIVGRAVNTNGVIYTRLLECFSGGYTHSNFIYSGRIIEDVDSWDFTSSYPFCLTCFRYPSTKFVKCILTKREDMLDRYAYILVVRLTNVKSKYYNHFLSMSKCRSISNGKYDNGRVMSADSLEITLTDIDFKLILDTYNCEYEILESYSALYSYLPKKFIEFVLDKYVKKTQYKGVIGKEVEYAKEKSMFNSLYGMSVTNNIRDEVTYSNDTGWLETPITNEEIEKKLKEEEKEGFLSFSYGCWCTSWARNNLIRSIMKLDDYMIYADTDSVKVCKGYNKDVIKYYNEQVRKRIKHVSEVLDIPMERFAPKDVNGEERMLGLFDDDGHYEEFITQGAKKYAVTKIIKKEKASKDSNIIEEYIDGKVKIIEITVSGVPKRGAKALKSLEEFTDDFVFEYKDTGKNLLIYVDNQAPVELTDYEGNTDIIIDKSGCCILPTTYVLGKTQEYANLLTENSSNRAIYKI